MIPILNYYIIKPITDIDYQKKQIIIKHDIDYLMVNIKHIDLDILNIVNISNISLSNIASIGSYNKLQNYLTKVKTYIKLPTPFEYGINYFIVPLAIIPNQIILGVIIFENMLLNLPIKYKVLDSWILLSNINSNFSNYDILAGSLKYIQDIPLSLKYYIMNMHNYLPKFKVIKTDKKIKVKDSFRKRNIE